MTEVQWVIYAGAFKAGTHDDLVTALGVALPPEPVAFRPL